MPVAVVDFAEVGPLRSKPPDRFSLRSPNRPQTQSGVPSSRQYQFTASTVGAGFSEVGLLSTLIWPTSAKSALYWHNLWRKTVT